MRELKRSLSKELEPFMDTSPILQRDTELQFNADHERRLVEVAKASTVVFEGLVPDGTGRNLDPTQAPEVGKYLPPILTQYLAWQQLIEMNKLRRKRDERPEPGEPTATLRDASGNTVEVTKNRSMVIGRKAPLFEPDMDVGDNMAISKRHAEVLFEGEDLMVKILGKNAVSVDGKLVHHKQSAPLKNGSVIRLGMFGVSVFVPPAAGRA